jgi:hypothetical protein
MQLIYFLNVPFGHKFDRSSVKVLHEGLSTVVGITGGPIQLHVLNTGYTSLLPDGDEVIGDEVHVFVYGFEIRVQEKEFIAHAIQTFLMDHGYGQESRIFFFGRFADDIYQQGAHVSGGSHRSAFSQEPRLGHTPLI